MRKIRKIVVHCSDSDDSLDFSTHDIRSWHLQRGWSDVGYHYVIRRNGKVEVGRKEETVGAHVAGQNSDSLGICWVGRKQIGVAQLKSLLALIRGLCFKYNIDPTENVFGHYEFDSGKSCPNLDMNRIRAELIFK